ncbi:MAG TPA: PRC-barrel domain-containing protein [Azonexus sp.]
MNIHRFGVLLLAGALASSLAGHLPAADQTTGRSAAATTGQSGQTAGRDLRASKVIGMKVSNPRGEGLGKIDDLIVDVNNERVAYAILSFGGMLGLGEKLFAYPLPLFQPAPGRNELVLNVDEERLKRAPGFERQSWPDWNQATYRGEVDRYFGATVSPKTMANQRLVRASELIGKNIDDRDGGHAGELEDLVVNLGSARIHYVIFDLDKAWSPNDKLVPVALRAFSFPNDRDRDLVLNVARSELDMSQGFDDNKWPDVSDPAYQRNIDNHLKRPAGSRSTGQAGPIRE